MTGFWVECWDDGLGSTWELVQTGLDEGGCIVREPPGRTDFLDGDVREGIRVVARFPDLPSAHAFLWSEGFEPRV